VVEAGSAALSAVTVKSKLRNDQKRASAVGYTLVHLAGFVGEDSQPRHFVGQVIRILFRVVLSHAQEHDEAAADRARNGSIHHYASFTHSLNDGTHMV